METCDASRLIMNYYWKKGDFCSSCHVSKPVFSLWKSTLLPAGDMRQLQGQVMHGREQNPHELKAATASVPVYLSNQPVDRRNEGPVWHSMLSLYNFRPNFPQRPLNLTAIWWFAAITVHSWVKINLWDSSLGQGFEDTWLCAGSDNLLWFIYLRMIPLI